MRADAVAARVDEVEAESTTLNDADNSQSVDAAAQCQHYHGALCARAAEARARHRLCTVHGLEVGIRNRL